MLICVVIAVAVVDDVVISSSIAGCLLRSLTVPRFRFRQEHDNRKKMIGKMIDLPKHKRKRKVTSISRPGRTL